MNTPDMKPLLTREQIEYLRPILAAMPGRINYGVTDILCDMALDSFTRPTPSSEYVKAVEALKELHAMVWGECSSLLNEDSGGDAKLDLKIKDIIAQAVLDKPLDKVKQA